MSRFIDDAAEEAGKGGSTWSLGKHVKEVRKRRKEQSESVESILDREHEEEEEEAERLEDIAELFVGGEIPKSLKGCNFMDFTNIDPLLQHFTADARKAYEEVLRIEHDRARLDALEEAVERQTKSTHLSVFQNMATFALESTRDEQKKDALDYSVASTFVKEFFNKFVENFARASTFAAHNREIALSKEWLDLTSTAAHYIHKIVFYESPKGNQFRVEFTCTNNPRRGTNEREAHWRLSFPKEEKGCESADVQRFWVLRKGGREQDLIDTLKLPEMRKRMSALVYEGNIKSWIRAEGGLANLDQLIALILVYGALVLDMRKDLVYPKQPDVVTTASKSRKRKDKGDEDEDDEEEDEDYEDEEAASESEEEEEDETTEQSEPEEKPAKHKRLRKTKDAEAPAKPAEPEPKSSEPESSSSGLIEVVLD